MSMLFSFLCNLDNSLRIIIPCIQNDSFLIQTLCVIKMSGYQAEHQYKLHIKKSYLKLISTSNKI